MTDRPTSAPQPVAGWVPIETAPKDGTAVLCFWPPSEGVPHAGCYGVAESSDGHWHNPEDSDDLYREPAHWMPMPAPPGEQPPLYDQAALDAVMAEERAFWLQAIALAQQCIAAAYNDQWPEFDRLSDQFDDACADAVLRLKPEAAAIRAATPQEPTK